MSLNQLDLVSPLASALPEPPADRCFTDEQWQVLLALMNTVIPSIQRESSGRDELSTLAIPDSRFDAIVDQIKATTAGSPDSDALDNFFAEKASDSPEFEDQLLRILMTYSREDARKGLALVMSTLNTRVGCLLLTGSATPIHEQPVSVRTAILERWRLSYLPPLRVVHKQLTFLAKNLFLKSSLTFPNVSGFPKVPQHWKPGPHFEYEFLQFPAGSGPEIIETDVVIVGSGCGGAVCAKNIAEAGHRVLVLDKSYCYAPSSLPMTESEAGVHLYENGGVVGSDDASISVIAGSTWGGGGSINWSASLNTQSFVRKEWAQDRGLKFFESSEFSDCLDTVCERMGVSTKYVKHNHGNDMILEGARKLGYAAKEVPQNTGGHEHSCGHCTLGCGAAEKQGPVVSWLPDAARAGAEFVEGFKVDKILFEDVAGLKTAVGVKGLWTSRNAKGGVDGPAGDRIVREVIVKAKRVIVSSGTLWSPAILMKSGITNNHLGQNLRLHPVTFVAAVYEEDVRPWEGPILTSVCTAFENLDGHGHGTKIEHSVMMPSWCLTFMNWKNGFDWKQQVLKFRHMNCFISLVRDRDGGRVYLDPNEDQIRIAYTPSKFDRANGMEGMIGACRIAYATAALEVQVFITGVEPFIRRPTEPETKEATDARFERWLASVQAAGNLPPAASWASAHQMGTCRMATSAANGVVDATGKVFGTEGCYVADASVFPSASGVNPMITNMAISDWISRGVAKGLGRQHGGSMVEARL